MNAYTYLIASTVVTTTAAVICVLNDSPWWAALFVLMDQLTTIKRKVD